MESIYQIKGIPSGFPSLDEITGGWQRRPNRRRVTPLRWKDRFWSKRGHQCGFEHAFAGYVLFAGNVR